MSIREIKFRAWDGNSMSPVARVEMYSDTKGNWHYQYEPFSHTPIDHEEPGTALMQFTGLQDKNGKEIYEGDVVQGVVAYPQLLTGDSDKNCNFKMAGEVFYDLAGFSLKAIQSRCDPKRDGLANYFDFIGDSGETFDYMEVIGNIYENSDLLK